MVIMRKIGGNILAILPFAFYKLRLEFILFLAEEDMLRLFVIY